MPGMKDARFEILVVCTGNICRSPAAEYLFRDVLDDSVRVASAGTHAVVGAPVEPDLVHRMSVPCQDFRATQLTPMAIKRAGLILGLTREHRARIVETSPPALRRTFTLNEFARILALPELRFSAPDAAGYLRHAVPLGARLRMRAPIAAPDMDDVADPYGRGEDAFIQAFDEISAAIHQIVTTMPRNTESVMDRSGETA